MLPYRKIAIPVTLIVLAVLGAVALVAIDTNIAINDPAPLPSGVRSDARLWATLLGIGGMVWLAVLAVLTHQIRGREAVMRTILDRTDPMSRRSRFHVVGTAAVANATEAPTEPLPAVDLPAAKGDELPGYARGYADGLARRPMTERGAPADPTNN